MSKGLIRYKGLRSLSSTLKKKQKAIKKADSELFHSALKVERDAKIGAPVDTGVLRNSLHTTKMKFLQYKVSDGVNYGVFLEFGTRFIAGRHFLQIAAKKNAKAIARAIVKVYK